MPMPDQFILGLFGLASSHSGTIDEAVRAAHMLRPMEFGVSSWEIFTSSALQAWRSWQGQTIEKTTEHVATNPKHTQQP